MLWHDAEPIGICVFTSPALSLRQRNRYFGLSSKWSRVKFRVLNAKLITLSRVVIHPTYRGAGLAAAFIRRSCDSCQWSWVETLAQMGHLNPFFERAGFVRVGVTQAQSHSIAGHSAIYGNRNNRHGKQRFVSEETHKKSRYAEPVYYIFDNRQKAKADSGPEESEISRK